MQDIAYCAALFITYESKKNHLSLVEFESKLHLIDMWFRVILLLHFSLMILSCETMEIKERPFKTFVFYHSNTWSTAFSIKFT